MATGVCKNCYKKGRWRIFKQLPSKHLVKRTWSKTCPECMKDTRNVTYDLRTKEEWLVHEELLEEPLK